MPLFLAIRFLTPFRAMFCGALWGFCLNAFLISGYGQTTTPLADSFALLIMIPAIYAFAGSQFTRRIGFSPLLLAFGWVGVEFALRPLGLGYGMLATTQENGGILQVVGGPLGYLFVAFLIALINAKLLSFVNDARFKTGKAILLLRSGEPRAWVSSRSCPGILVFAADSFRPRGPPLDESKPG